MRGGATAGRLRREPRRLGMIGTAYDGSAESRAALEVAAGLAAQRNARVDIVAVASYQYLAERTDRSRIVTPPASRGSRNRSHRNPDRAEAEAVRASGAVVRGRRAACWPSEPSLDPLVLRVTAARPARGLLLGSGLLAARARRTLPPARSAAPLATRRRDCARWLASWIFFPRRRRAAGRPWRREARRRYTGAPVHPSIR
jgi:hypothetical protein